MTEELLHHIWKFRLFDTENLMLESGETLQIINVGSHNTDAGPDFFNARIKIGNTLWAGNIELHINASDWHKHGHQKDKAYDNILLHVVFDADVIVNRNSGEAFPTLVLKNKINPRYLSNYDYLKSAKVEISCEKIFFETDIFVLNNWLDRLMIERLEQKSEMITRYLKLNHNDWEETFYQFLARNFGFKINADAFELLAKSLPNAYLAKHKNNLFQIEALLFGQAGFLEKKFSDDYPQQLQKEYFFLKKKFRLQNLEPHLWKMLRLRPVNFPTVRLAQFAKLISISSHLFSKIMETETLEEIEKLLTVETSDYWKTHFHFEKKSRKQTKKLGKMAIENIVINTLVPFLFVYGKHKSEEEFVERALTFLQKTNPEKNHITETWKKLGMKMENAFVSQASIQLKNDYCSQKKCLQCAVGNYLLKKDS